MEVEGNIIKKKIIPVDALEGEKYLKKQSLS